MNVTPSRRNKVVLSDYSYRRDVESRMQLAQMTAFDLQVLDEVLCCSLILPVKHLVEYLESSAAEVIASLDKFVPARLLEHDGWTIRVDKEMRKYFEAQIQKFDDDFIPGIEHVMRSLKQLPIQVLPEWYAIPRTTDDIIESVLDKYLRTPKAYLAHLAELRFDDPILARIAQDVFESDDLLVSAQQLCETYHLTHEQFEECMLLLEHNFVCFLGYRCTQGVWEEVVTPMREWRDYLKFLRDNSPKYLAADQVRASNGLEDFAFVRALTVLAQAVSTQPVEAQALAEQHGSTKLSRLLQLGLCIESGGLLYPGDDIARWMRLKPQDQAMLVYRLAIVEEEYSDIDPIQFTEKNLRQVERELRRVLQAGWVRVTEFLVGMTEPLNAAQPVSLRQQGKRWAYVIPEYSDAERQFVTRILLQRLYEVGVVVTGTCADGPCFMVSPFGALLLGD